MPNDPNLLLANPDFVSIRSSYVDFLKSQTRFKDFDFTGSNISVLLDLLAYNAYQNAFHASMVATEMFLDTATLRSSVLSHSKELSYTPRSARSSVAYIDLTITPTDTPGSIVLPKGTSFSTSVGSRVFLFQTLEANIIQPTDGIYKITNLPIHEGFSTSETFVVDNSRTNQRFVLSNPNIDTQSLVVNVNGVPFKNGSSIIELTETSNVYFLQLDKNGLYELVFGDNILGTQPEHQSIIQASYLVSSLDAANGATSFRVTAPISGYTNVAVDIVTAAAGGGTAESTESIRKNAPRFYQTRNRAVTSEDYKILLQQQFPEIQTINVYGGETADPPQYGKVFISVNVANVDGLPRSAQERYYRYIKDKTPLTIEPAFVTPSTLKLKLVCTVYYDYNSYFTSKSDIETAVLQSIMEFNAAEVEGFNSNFEFSQLGTVIDASSSAILSNETSVEMVLTIDNIALASNIQVLKFQNPIMGNSAEPVVKSSQFVFNNSVCWFEDDGEGNLALATLNNNTKTIVNAKIGSVTYDTGVVKINKTTVDRLLANRFELFAVPANKNISSQLNVVMKIDPTYVSITAKPKKNTKNT